MGSPRAIVLATGNAHKVDELRAIMGPLGIQLLALPDVPGAPFQEPAETGDSFLANATIKALAYARATGRFCLADDSGLIVDALDGRPGVISSHYSTDGRDTGLTREDRDEANTERVLREMLGVPEAKRTARFACVMVLAAPPSAPGQDARVVARTHGLFQGRIGLPSSELSDGSVSLAVPRGVGGFGYDPIFLVAPEHAKTSAELPASRKNELSHRGHAAREMARRLVLLGFADPARERASATT